jgi:hypothetical protein
MQIMEYFRTFKEQRFAWESLGPRFAEAFRQVAQPRVVKTNPFMRQCRRTNAN